MRCRSVLETFSRSIAAGESLSRAGAGRQREREREIEGERERKGKRESVCVREAGRERAGRQIDGCGQTADRGGYCRGR